MSYFCIDAFYKSLRHIFHHGTTLYPSLHRRIDITDSDSVVWIESSEDGSKSQVTRPLIARSRPMYIERLRNIRPAVVEPLVSAARETGGVWEKLPLSAWSIEEIPGPNITDKDTILTFAQMTANAYIPEPNKGDWRDIGGFNKSFPFGWEEDGIRGHIYTNPDSSIVVIAFKGTSRALWDGTGTTKNDKDNDNLFFGCCCGQGSYFYRHVCDCNTGTYTCNMPCLRDKMRQENRYYAAVKHLYSNVTTLYPDAEVWLAGHSLGGALSGLLGLTYGRPAVTFEAIPDALPAGRLGLPFPPGSDPGQPQARENTGAFHFGITSDPVYLGTCNGATASCSFAGYALESACHTGMECVYDVVKDWGWRVWIGTHGIDKVIDNVIKKYDTVPECKYTPECKDCAQWKETEDEYTTTSSQPTSTRTRTRTSTCKTPGWWGCLDETTTSLSISTSSTTTTSTTSCKTHRWLGWGCKDKDSTTALAGSVIYHFTPTQTLSVTSTTRVSTSGALEKS
jgi:lipase ATG15